MMKQVAGLFILLCIAYYMGGQTGIDLEEESKFRLEKAEMILKKANEKFELSKKIEAESEAKVKEAKAIAKRYNDQIKGRLDKHYEGLYLVKEGRNDVNLKYFSHFYIKDNGDGKPRIELHLHNKTDKLEKVSFEVHFLSKEGFYLGYSIAKWFIDELQPSAKMKETTRVPNQFGTAQYYYIEFK